MGKELIKMRQLRNEQFKIKARLSTHELYAAKLRSNITNAWDDKSKENVVATNALLLQEARADINACQSKLREIKRSYKAYNRVYDIRHAKK